MADGAACSRSQDDCRLPQGQWPGHPSSLRPVHYAVRTLGLFADVSVAIDGSKFKAVNNRDKNFTRAKMERRMAQIEESVARYLQQLGTAAARSCPRRSRSRRTILGEKIEKLKQKMLRLATLEVECSPHRTNRSR